MITVTINGKEIRLEKPVTVLEAAEMNGIEIPHFCHHPLLEKWGGCRMCLVEVEKIPKLQTSCTLMVTDGMVVRTESEEIAKARKGVLEFLLINHPLDCPVCDKAGECSLQDLTVKYGAAAGRFEEGKRKHPESFDDPLIVRNMERCILCTRCVRMCDGVQGDSAIAVTNRGARSFVEPFSGGRYNCEYCGNCLTVCPVGAILSRLHVHSYRSWLIERDIRTVCPYCGVGCSFVLQIRDNRIIRSLPRPEVGINRGILCAKGRFGYDYISNSERLRAPLVRRDGKLQPVSWDEAIALVANRLIDIRDKHGGESIGGIASARCTNEENYVFQKLFRAGLRSNNIDSIARTGFAAAQRYIEDVLGHGATANLISGIPKSEGVIVVGGDPTHINPVLGVHVRDAFRRGARVLTIGYAPGLERFSTHKLSPYPFTEGALLSAMLGEIINQKEPHGENRAFEERIKEFKGISLTDMELVCGINGSALSSSIKDMIGRSTISMIIGPDIIQRTDIRTNIFLLSAIAYMLDASVYLLSERPNEQGLIDVGCLPDTLPGGRPVEIESFRRRDEELWGCEVPSKTGLTLLEMVEAANSGVIRAMYIMGENPVYNLPDSSFVRASLEKLEFLVVQDIFMTETAEAADVVLPSLGWTEKDGSYTNLERRIQSLQKAINIDGMEDWRILSEIGKKIGIRMPYNSSADILEEISRVSPLHAGLTYDDMERDTGLWPYKGEPLRHRPGAGDWPLADLWVPIGKDKLYLFIERHMFLSGTMSRYSSALNSIYEEPLAKINPDTARRFGLSDGDIVDIKTERGGIALPVKTDKKVSEFVVLLSNNFREKGAMSLIPFRADPVTKVPCINGIEVIIERVK
ncbi:MAG: formate dehydrogenase subunit alpha [Thermodesulfovibrionales bacterium]